MSITGRRFRHSLLAFMLLAAAIAGGALARPSPMEGPVSIRARWQLHEAVALDEFSGFWTGVLSEGTAKQPELALAWSVDAQAFWPTWRIQVVARRDALAPGAGLRRLNEFEHWPGMEGLTLATVQPTSGHQYESCLSYDPELGGLSVVITDTTTGYEIVAESVAVPVQGGAFYYATDLMSGGQAQMASAEVLQVAPGYIPWGVRWNTAVRESAHGVPLATDHLRRADEAILALSIPHPLRGQFVLSLVQDDRQLELGRVSLPGAAALLFPCKCVTGPWDWPLWSCATGIDRSWCLALKRALR